jgi:nucleoside diphosphate kinase
MNDQLTYALITPYSLYKSRTGGIISRLLADDHLDFVAARMFVLSDEFLDAYTKVFIHDESEPAVWQAWKNYIERSLRPKNPYGNLPRCMFMLFKGPDAVRYFKHKIVGSFTESPTGDTVRGTYGDFVRSANGEVHYLEPGVLTSGFVPRNHAQLKLFADFACKDGGVLEGKMEYESKPETTLVMLKPDNFYKASRRPGNIIDTFSDTGLRIVGAKLFNMSLSQGQEFYGPLKDLFVKKLRFMVSKPIRSCLDDTLAFEVTDGDVEAITDLFAERNATTEFNKILGYMTGISPDDVAEGEVPEPSNARCLAILYEGVGAIQKVRAALGATNPAEAKPGTVRSDFGNDLMRNGAHASDSVDNAMRERHIVGLAPGIETEPCDVQKIIYPYLENLGMM